MKFAKHAEAIGTCLMLGSLMTGGLSAVARYWTPNALPQTVVVGTAVGSAIAFVTGSVLMTLRLHKANRFKTRLHS